MCCIITEGSIYKVKEKDGQHFVIKTEGKPYNGDDYKNQISGKNDTKPANDTNEVLPEKTSNNAKGSKKATKKTKISGDKMDDVIDKAKNTSKQANETKEFLQEIIIENANVLTNDSKQTNITADKIEDVIDEAKAKSTKINAILSSDSDPSMDEYNAGKVIVKIKPSLKQYLTSKGTTKGIRCKEECTGGATCLKHKKRWGCFCKKGFYYSGGSCIQAGNKNDVKIIFNNKELANNTEPSKTRTPKDNSTMAKWKKIDEELSNLKSAKRYNYSSYPPTMSLEFRNTVQEFAREFLKTESFEEFTDRINFAKESKMVNPVVLRYATTTAAFQREDMDNFVPELANSQMEMTQNKSISDGEGEDYAVTEYIEGRNIKPSDFRRMTGDREERKLEYWREDPLLHVFHTTLHVLELAMKLENWEDRRENREKSWPRLYEQFWFAHAQLIKRYGFERESVGVSPVKTISHNNMMKIRYGYKMGPYTRWALQDRKERCGINTTQRANLQRNFTNVERGDDRKSLDLIGEELAGWYHSSGHNFLADKCGGGTARSEVAARDPWFFGWHGHLEQIMRKYRNSKEIKYNLNKFRLTGGLAVKSVQVNQQRGPKNVLSTFTEIKKMTHKESFTMEYERISHRPFVYTIKLANPRRIRKKVMVRIWLVNRRNQKGAIMLDKFVYNTAEGNQIKRSSRSSAVTMKENRNGESNLERMAAHITKEIDETNNWKPKLDKKSETWCGFPHHLLLPRGRPARVGGSRYDLLVMVNDVAQDVNEGDDGVEHVICGHKFKNATLDTLPFGFPFDRDTEYVDIFSPAVRATRSVAYTKIRIKFEESGPTRSGGGDGGWNGNGNGNKRRNGNGFGILSDLWDMFGDWFG